MAEKKRRRSNGGKWGTSCLMVHASYIKSSGRSPSWPLMSFCSLYSIFLKLRKANFLGKIQKEPFNILGDVYQI